MNDLSPSAGVDVGSLWLDLGFHPFAKPIRAPNREAGIATILAALRERGAGQVAIEAIGGYARKLRHGADRGGGEGFPGQSEAHQGVSRRRGPDRQDRQAGRQPDCALCSCDGP